MTARRRQRRIAARVRNRRITTGGREWTGRKTRSRRKPSIGRSRPRTIGRKLRSTTGSRPLPRIGRKLRPRTGRKLRPRTGKRSRQKTRPGPSRHRLARQSSGGRSVLAGTATSYDLLPYSSKPYALTHPDNLATIAALAGLRTPSLDRCRVLELGCGAGGNLIPMAMSLPGARFVGIDLSRRQIADARSMAHALGLTNVDFRAHDLADIDDALGVFDFIVCHGVFSGVPATVREAILAVCRRNLHPDGVASVSYNVYPGWHLKGLVRDMLLFRVGGDGEPQARIQRARSVLGEIARDVTDRRDSYGRLLRDEVTK